MKRISQIVLACACAMALPVAALAQGATASTTMAKGDNSGVKAGEIEVRAKVVELNMAQRTATLRGPKGKLVTVDVPPEAKNFEQVRVGDELVVRYAAALAMKLEPTAKKSGIRERIESSTQGSAPAGSMPAAASGRTVEALGIVQAINRKASTVTVRGVQRTVTLNVPANVDIAKIKVGDEVRAVFIEAAVMTVERAPQAAAKPAAKASAAK